MNNYRNHRNYRIVKGWVCASKLAFAKSENISLKSTLATCHELSIAKEAMLCLGVFLSI